MRIIQLTPGTGYFHCGSCLRDNALVNALRNMGHDALMVPMYLPHVVDEKEAADGMPIFFGGVSLYLQQKSHLFRHVPGWIDRVLNAPAVLKRVAARSGMTSAKDLGELTISMLQGEDGHQRKQLGELIDWLTQQPPIDVVCLSNILLAGLVKPIKRALKVPVVCTLQGEDSYLDGLSEPYRTEAWDLVGQTLRHADSLIAVSHYYAEVMQQRLAIDEPVHVVHNGIQVDDYAPAAKPNPPAVGYLARMCEAKGLGTLLEAFILLKQRNTVPDLQLRVAGSMTAPDRSYVQSLRRRLADAGYEADASFQPNLDHAQKTAHLQSLSVFSVPATYGESFGLYVLESLACGVPVVQPRHAAFVEILEALGGGILCEPDNPAALADGLEQLLTDHKLAGDLALQGRKSVMERFTADRMAMNVLRLLQKATNTPT